MLKIINELNKLGVEMTLTPVWPRVEAATGDKVEVAEWSHHMYMTLTKGDKSVTQLLNLEAANIIMSDIWTERVLDFIRDFVKEVTEHDR